MTSISVDEVQSRIAALVDQDEATANISAGDYSLRLKYINQSLTEWAEVNDWQVLFGEYNVLVSTSTGNASITLPSNFRKAAANPKITWDGSTTDEFKIIYSPEKNYYDDSVKMVRILGNPKNGYILRVNGVTLVSGASVKLPYYASVQSLVSPANIAEIPNPDYLVKRTVAYLWEAREDPRFPQMKQEAETILRNMIEYENVFPIGSDESRTKTVEETSNFKWGLD